MNSGAVCVRGLDQLEILFSDNTDPRQMVDELAADLGFIVRYKDMENSGRLSFSGEVYVIELKKTDPQTEQHVSLVHELLHAKYPSNYLAEEFDEEYENRIEKESQRLIGEHPDLPDYIISKARKIENW